jgi:hypothetical protein
VSYCPRCSKPLDARAAACPHCGYDFPASPPGPAAGPSWVALGFAALWVVAGVVGLFLSPARASDWCLVGFAIAGGLAGVLWEVEPLLGPEAARLAGPAAAGCAVLATGAAIACVWLGERDTNVVVWLALVAAALAWGAWRVLRRARGRAAELLYGPIRMNEDSDSGRVAGDDVAS